MSTEEFAGADSGILKRTAKKGVFGTRPLLGSKFFYRGEGVNDLRNDCVVFFGQISWQKTFDFFHLYVYDAKRQRDIRTSEKPANRARL